MVFTSSSKKIESREVKCSECGTFNQVNFHGLAGILTIFCKECGEEIRLVYDRTLMGMELKKETRKF